MGQIHLLSTTGKRVRALREAKGWTQIELAERVTQLGKPLGNPQISRIESDLARPSISTLRALALALETTTDFLTVLTDSPAPETSVAVGGPRQS